MVHTYMDFHDDTILNTCLAVMTLYAKCYCVHVCTSSDIYRSKDLIKNFDELLKNLFVPLYEVSLNPQSHKKLHKFLQQVGVC